MPFSQLFSWGRSQTVEEKNIKEDPVQEYFNKFAIYVEDTIEEDLDDSWSLASDNSSASWMKGAFGDAKEPEKHICQDDEVSLSGFSEDEDDTPVPKPPIQKVTWDVKKNTICYDLGGLCLCSKDNCHLKFGSKPKVDKRKLYSAYGFESEERMERETRKKEGEDTRRIIKLLEQQSKGSVGVMDEETLGILPPITLYSGVSFGNMTKLQLDKSYIELQRLIDNGRKNAELEWSFVFKLQQKAGATGRRNGVLDAAVQIAQREDEEVDHYQKMQGTVELLLRFRFTFDFD